jgi:hypothetical protein
MCLADAITCASFVNVVATRFDTTSEQSGVGSSRQATNLASCTCLDSKVAILAEDLGCLDETLMVGFVDCLFGRSRERHDLWIRTRKSTICALDCLAMAIELHSAGY